MRLWGDISYPNCNYNMTLMKICGEKYLNYLQFLKKIKKFFLVGLGFEIRASCLQNRHSTA
jgi:hypothetical protein